MDATAVARAALRDGFDVRGRGGQRIEPGAFAAV